MTKHDIKIRVADWLTDKHSLSQIRRLVFIDEQKVPEELEWDEHDSSSTHFLVTADNTAIATARLKTDGQIGRMAVLPELRNLGVGSKLLQYILQYAVAQNMGKVYLHAQLSAIAFYEKQHFSPQGDIFYEANSPHRTMKKILFSNDNKK